MTDDIEQSKDEEWDEEVPTTIPLTAPEDGNVMQFSDFVEPDEKHLQKQRITELRRRAEERQDWKRISGEFEWDFDLDDQVEEA